MQLRVLRIQQTKQCSSQIKGINLNLTEDKSNNNSYKTNKFFLDKEEENDNSNNNLSISVNDLNENFCKKSLNADEQSDENFLLIEDDDIFFSYESGSFDASAEWFSLLTEHLVILSLLQILPPYNENETLKSDNKMEFNNAFGIEIETLNRLTLERMAQKGFGFYREQVNKYKIIFFF